MPIIGDREPLSSRYQAVEAVLADALCDPEIMRMVKHYECDEAGAPQLTDQFMSRLQVGRAWASLPRYQREAIRLAMGPRRWNQKKIGRRLHRTDRTVRTYIREGMETIIARVFAK